jgi:hypothetical protein
VIRGSWDFAEQIAGMRQDGSHTSAHVVATDDGRVPNLNASNIGDCIEQPGLQDAAFSPKSEARGRAMGTVLCATAGADTSSTAIAPRIFLVIADELYLWSW